MISCVFEDKNAILWLGTNDGLWRVNEKEEEPLDRVTHFRATAYMLDNEIIAINGDNDNGVHVLTKTSVAHIAMKYMTAKEKAIFLSDINEKHVQRRGMLSGARWNEKTNAWHGTVDDNDGLWTSIVAMGDICRYAVLRDDPTATKKEIERAKQVATRWVEAELLLAYIPSRKGKVASFIRYNQPGVNRSSKAFLLEGKEGTIDMPTKGPTGYISSDIGPLNLDDWATARNRLPQY
jgi:hypothetical protein